MAEWPDGFSVVRLSWDRSLPDVPVFTCQLLGEGSVLRLGLPRGNRSFQILSTRDPRIRFDERIVSRLRWLLLFLGVREPGDDQPSVFTDVDHEDAGLYLIVLERGFPMPESNPMLEAYFSDFEEWGASSIARGEEIGEERGRVLFSYLASLISPIRGRKARAGGLFDLPTEGAPADSPSTIRCTIGWTQGGVHKVLLVDEVRRCWARLGRAMWSSDPDSPPILPLCSEDGSSAVFVARSDLGAFLASRMDPGDCPVDQEILELYRILGSSLPFLMPFEQLLEWAMEI